MIPVSDVIPSRTTPWVTLGLVAANAVVFLYEQSLSAPDISAFLRQTAFVPGDASWITATTSLFVHENGLHVALNLVALWIFGDNVEDQLGHGRFLMTYFAAGYASCAAESLATAAAFVPFVGASGAVAGVIGAYFVMFPRSRVLVLVPARAIVDAIELPAVLVAGAWFAPQILGNLGRIAEPWNGPMAVRLWPVVGGVLAGVACSLARRPERRRVDWWGA